MALFGRRDATLPEYTVRESRRARHVQFRVSTFGRLEVVVPAGFNHRRIPKLIAGRRNWIEQALAKAAERRDHHDEETAGPRPTRIELRAVGETWHVEYAETGRPGCREGEAGLLRVCGTDTDTCHEALRRWLARRARSVLTERLAAIAAETGLAYAGVTVRGQRTRWGSCSSRGTISLNRKLLFLPPELVRYVLVHELCHTRELNHSRRFWATVARFDPDYRVHEAALRDAWRHVPPWFEED